MPETVRSYRDLVVWQKAMALAVSCYQQTKCLPASEMYGMASQIRRAAASIPANIAEGNGRETTGSYIHFLRIAQGSLKELETHILLCQTVLLIENQNAEDMLLQCETIGKMLRALIRSLQQKEASE